MGMCKEVSQIIWITILEGVMLKEKKIKWRYQEAYV
jgi:hypothetical protein